MSSSVVAFKIYKLLISSKLPISVLDNVNLTTEHIKFENKFITEINELNYKYNDLEKYVKNNDIKKITTKLYFFGNIIIDPSINYIKNLIIGSFRFNNTFYYYYTFVLINTSNMQINHPLVISQSLNLLLDVFLPYNDLRLLEAWFKARMVGYFVSDNHVRIFDDYLDYYVIDEQVLRRYFIDYVNYCNKINCKCEASFEDFKEMNNIC